MGHSTRYKGLTAELKKEGRQPNPSRFFLLLLTLVLLLAFVPPVLADDDDDDDGGSGAGICKNKNKPDIAYSLVNPDPEINEIEIRGKRLHNGVDDPIVILGKKGSFIYEILPVNSKDGNGKLIIAQMPTPRVPNGTHHLKVKSMGCTAQFHANVGPADLPDVQCTTDSDCQDDGTFCNGPEICQSGSCVSSGDPCIPAVCDEVDDSCTGAATCGNNMVEGDEQCDGGVCCNSDCTLASSSTVCRPAAVASCDIEETCNGTPDCPVDRVAPIGTGSSECSPFNCDGAGSCQTACISDSDCVVGNFCDGNSSCEPLLPSNESCTRDGECQSMNCVIVLGIGFCQ